MPVRNLFLFPHLLLCSWSPQFPVHCDLQPLPAGWLAFDTAKVLKSPSPYAYLPAYIHTYLLTCIYISSTRYFLSSLPKTSTSFSTHHLISRNSCDISLPRTAPWLTTRPAETPNNRRLICPSYLIRRLSYWPCWLAFASSPGALSLFLSFKAIHFSSPCLSSPSTNSYSIPTPRLRVDSLCFTTFEFRLGS